MAQTSEEGVTLSSVFSDHATKTGVHGLEASVFCQLHDFNFIRSARK
jgi:hypothetical protein